MMMSDEAERTRYMERRGSPCQRDGHVNVGWACVVHKSLSGYLFCAASIREFGRGWVGGLNAVREGSGGECLMLG